MSSATLNAVSSPPITRFKFLASKPATPNAALASEVLPKVKVSKAWMVTLPTPSPVSAIPTVTLLPPKTAPESLPTLTFPAAAAFTTS